MNGLPLPPPGDHHVGEILALHDRYDVSAVIDNQLMREEHPFSLPLHVAAVLLAGKSAGPCREWLIQLVTNQPTLEAASVKLELIMQTAVRLGHRLQNEHGVEELQLVLTQAAHGKHVGSPLT
ncbi:MAG: hypothetical protein AAB776_03015 [Patescibacteria group bacterium]